jgi:nucleotide-binding universal stress UspA family protein
VSVLAYIDGSQFTESVCLHAAWAAHQLHAGVRLVHVIDLITNPSPIEDRLPGSAIDGPGQDLAELVDLDRRIMTIEQDDQREVLLQAARDIRSRGIDKVQTAIEFGTLEDHIREHGQESRLAVLGKRGESSGDRPGGLGDHLEQVLRASPCPLLIAPSDPHEIRRFIIAFDGGPQSGHAIRFLIEQPLLRECEGTLLLAGNHTGLRQQLNDAASHLRSAGYQVQAEIGHGDPDRLIPDILNTEDIDLLVMGAFGHSRLHTLFGRSTTRKLLRSSSKAILVVR